MNWLILAVDVLGMGYAVSVPSPRVYRGYFLVLLTQAVICCLIWPAHREYRSAYVSAWCLTELAVIAAMLALAWHFTASLRIWPDWCTAWGLGLSCGLAYAASCRWGSLYEAMPALDGTLSVFLAVPSGWGGVALIRRMPLERTGRLAIGFAVLWIAYAAFTAGFSIYGSEASWLRMDEWIPAVLMSVGCAALASALVPRS